MMNKKDNSIIVELLAKRFPKNALDDLQKSAVLFGLDMVEDREEFESWIVDQCLDSMIALFQTYKVDFE
jgi:hypothetical protein